MYTTFFAYLYYGLGSGLVLVFSERLLENETLIIPTCMIFKLPLFTFLVVFSYFFVLCNFFIRFCCDFGCFAIAENYHDIYASLLP